MKYFAYDPECGPEFFESKEQAIEYCNQALEIAQECAQFDNEWPEWVDSICWGEIKQIASECNIGKDNTCDYEMRDV